MNQRKERSNTFYIFMGLGFGLTMFAALELIDSLIDNERIIVSRIIISLLVWLIVGLGFGYITKVIARKNKNGYK